MSTPLVTATIADLLTIVPGHHDDVAAIHGHDEPQVRALVAAAREGDRDAYGDLVSRYQTSVIRTASAALGSAVDAEDVAQEAFLLAWQKLPQFRGESSFRTWLLTITWRKAIDRRRRQRRWWSPLPAAGLESPSDIADLIVDGADDPEQTALTRDMARQLAQGIARLSPTLRDTLLLAAAGDHSYAEIAVILGIPLGTVKWRVAEARRVVRQGLPDA